MVPLHLRQRLTARIGGPVAESFEPASVAELIDVIGALRARGRAFRLLGGGSNIVAGDGPLDEAIVLLRSVKKLERPTATRWRADAGVALGLLVHASAREGPTGLECCAGVPGTFGAAVRINAGGKWGTIGAVLREVTLLGRDGRVVTRAVTAEDVAYRRTAWWDDIVLAATVELAPAADREAPGARIREVLAHKKATQPLQFPSAGCIFRNPSKEQPAGRLIDQAGLKGTRVGGALVSPLHANYIVNTGGATGADFVALIEQVRARVQEVHGVRLELEVELWGASLR